MTDQPVGACPRPVTIVWFSVVPSMMFALFMLFITITSPRCPRGCRATASVLVPVLRNTELSVGISDAQTAAMSGSGRGMQFPANDVAAIAERPKVLKTTAHGAARPAGQKAGLYPDQQAFLRIWSPDLSFAPQMPDDARDAKCAAWRRAVVATLWF